MPNDINRYFRIEAKEIIESLTQGVLELEKGNFAKDLVGHLLRLAHTLKGAARIVNQVPISEMSHAIEDVVSPHRETTSPIPRRDIDELLRLVDGIAAAVSAIEGPPARAERYEPEASPQPAGEGLETVRIEISEMDALLREAAQARSYQTALQQELSGFGSILRMAGNLTEPSGISSRSRSGRESLPDAQELQLQLGRLHQRLSIVNEKTERELARLQERVGELRLLPASSVFASLERAVRDAAVSLGKKVEFQANGGENRLDAHVLRALQDALVHVVRNAVAHGIEPESERLSTGKPASGRVLLRVERRANRVIFACEDDGAGIDPEQVRRAAVERGVLTESEASGLEPQATLKLLFHGGLTTSSKVTSVSGRGVGLDVVQKTINGLKGEVRATSTPAAGTTIELSVPVSLEALAVLEAQVGGSVVSVPFDAVVQSMRLAGEDIARSADKDSILFDGKVVPFVPLVALLRPRAATVAVPRLSTVLIVQDGSKLAAIGLDRVLQRRTVVMKPLPRLAGRVELIAGASFDSEGNPQLVIDPQGLIRLAHRSVRSRAQSAAPHKLAPVLVIDDSLTTRMLEQSILENAGYEVDLAVSGEEALKKARQRQYGMFVVDIEMPGIDGFEFIERVQADPQLRGIPAILVSSRSSIEDRRRGEQVGARAYIVKSEFDEGRLLGTIRELMG